MAPYLAGSLNANVIFLFVFLIIELKSEAIWYPAAIKMAASSFRKLGAFIQKRWPPLQSQLSLPKIIYENKTCFVLTKLNTNIKLISSFAIDIF